MSDVFNTPFEIALRVLIILNTAKVKLSIDRITCFDFISTYGVDFGVSEYNLHGNNKYRFGEYAIKRAIVSKSLKRLVLKGYIKPFCSKNGFSYYISESGSSFCQSLHDDYADSLESIVNNTISVFSEFSDRRLTCFINENAIAMLGGNKL